MLEAAAHEDVEDAELEADIQEGLAAALPSMLGLLPVMPLSPSMIALFAATAPLSTASGIPSSDSMGSLSALAAFSSQFEQPTADIPASAPSVLFADTSIAASTPLRTASGTTTDPQSIQLSPTAAERSAITLLGDATQYANQNADLPPLVPLNLSTFLRRPSDSSLNTTGSSPSAGTGMTVGDAPPAD